MTFICHRKRSFSKKYERVFFEICSGIRRYKNVVEMKWEEKEAKIHEKSHLFCLPAHKSFSAIYNLVSFLGLHLDESKMLSFVKSHTNGHSDEGLQKGNQCNHKIELISKF